MLSWLLSSSSPPRRGCPRSLGCPPASGSGAVVMMKAAEHGDGLDRASKLGSGAFRADRSLLADALVRPSRVEVAQGILGEEIPQVPLRQDDHVVEALAADATQEAFAHRIHQGRPDRGVQDARPDARGDAVEDGSELPRSNPEYVAHPRHRPPESRRLVRDRLQNRGTWAFLPRLPRFCSRSRSE